MVKNIQLSGPRGPSGFPAASVSSFGFGGTNGHVVLAASAKAEKKRSTGARMRLGGSGFGMEVQLDLKLFGKTKTAIE